MATITISRETGCDKGEFAGQLAKALGYGLLDKSIIELVARQMNARTEDVPDVEEIPEETTGVRKLLEQVLEEENEGRHPQHLSPWFRDNYPFDLSPYYDTDYQRYSKDVLNAQPARAITKEMAVKGYEQIIRHFAERGDAIIVGRGSQAVLKDVPWVFHIRLTAGRKTRITNVAEDTGLHEDEAEKFMDRSDKWRARYVKDNYGVEWDDPSLYHLTANMDRWKSYKLAEAIAAIVKSDAFRQNLNDLKKRYGKF
jgi:cytidylate kinase